MTIEFRVERLVFSDGTAMQLTQGAIVVFVGPNNSGKSEAIRNLSGALVGAPDRPVITSVDFHKLGTRADFESWLDSNATTIEMSNGRRVVSRVGAEQARDNALEDWTSGTPFWGIHNFLSLSAMAEARLSLVKSVPSYATRTEHPSNALQYLYADPVAEETISASIREAFGTGIVVDRTGGSQIYLLFGDKPVSPGTLPPTEEYLNEIKLLKQVDEQGDGVKSFTGLTMAVGTGVYPLVLVDEPEAFLHPPQARLLGQRLAAGAVAGNQMFLATHSADLLQGLIESGPSAVNVVRVTRSGNINPVAVLAPEQLSALWQDPLLRYSNVLDGLFHDKVVICESDADCRFYGATLDEMNSPEGSRKPEVLFAHAGGKARLHTIARAMRAIAVPTAVVADIDLLRNPADVRKIVEALGGDWAPLSARATAVKKTVDSLASETDVKTLLDGVTDAFAGRDPSSRALREDVEAARARLKVIDGWERLKNAGVAGMPNGAPTQTLTSLLDDLAAIGLHVVRVGELEGFDPSIGGHGPRWVTSALEAGSHRLVAPQAFIRKVLANTQ